MQIDFHHGVTYVLSRLAGFDQKEAAIIAHSSQFVDDATHDGFLRFDNYALFHTTPSAHKMVDYRNFESLKNHMVWIPFHFLPGNLSDKHPDIPDFVQRIICRPNSEPAQLMLRRCIEDKDRKHGLYRLGITMHVYADTWAHQGFAGISHPVNIAKTIYNWEGEEDFDMNNRVDRFFNGTKLTWLWNKIKAKFVTDVSPLGHGTVLSFPDKPYLKWKYRDHWDRIIERDNPKDYLDAIKHVYRALCQYRAGDPEFQPSEMNPKDWQAISSLIRDISYDDGERRHHVWLEKIAAGTFSFGKEIVEYHQSGPQSWEYQALGEECLDQEIYLYRDKFMDSHWKLFYDALSEHRHIILHEVLPHFNLCAA